MQNKHDSLPAKSCISLIICFSFNQKKKRKKKNKKNKQHLEERVITMIHVLSVKKRTGAQNPDQTYMITKT